MMKALFLISLFLINSACFSQTEKKLFIKSDSLLIERIKNENPNSYIGKTLAEYLTNEFLKNWIRWQPLHEPPGRLQAITLYYSEKVRVRIIFTNIEYQKQFSEKLKWDFSLVKKEKIYKINYSWEE